MRYKSIPALTPSQEERFWARVRVPDQPSCCWEWGGLIQANGYGRWYQWPFGGLMAHRLAYKLLIGSLADDADLDHLCRNKLCVNPDHLDPVSHRVNTLRGYSPMVRRAFATHCKRGHPYDPDDVPGRRHCRVCQRFSSTAWARRKREREERESA